MLELIKHSKDNIKVSQPNELVSDISLYPHLGFTLVTRPSHQSL